MSRVLLITVALLTAAPPRLDAQDTLMARLRTRADSLLRSWREAEALAGLADSLERERATAGRDTIAVGSMRIIANHSPLPLRAAAERAWPAIDSLYGAAAVDLVRQPYIIRAIDPDTAVRRADLYVGVELPWDLDVEAMTTFFLTTVAPPRFDPALSQWLGTGLRPTVRVQDERRDVFLQLVTAPSEAVRACFLGDVGRCRDVLELGDTTALLERWYVTPAEREALVTRSFTFFFERGPTAASLKRCRQHDDDACTTLLRSLPSGTLPRPLPAAARLALVREALQLGGRDAYARLVANPAAPLHERLAGAATVDIDALVARWHSSVIAARPARLTLPWWAAAAALGWTAVFGFCAVRSTRWRL